MDTVAAAPHGGKRISTSNSLLEMALGYAGKGWRVLPLHNPTSHGCSCGKDDCGSVGKHPRLVNGSKGASSDEEKIRGWWGKWSDGNIGIATGPESGLFVLDVDGKEGQESLGNLEQLPQTRRVLTGRTGPDGDRTGFHLYFNYPPGENLRNSTGRIGDGLDIRAAGGYVVAPPSLHASGLPYQWMGEDAIVDLPAWLIAKAAKVVLDVDSTLETRTLFEGERDDRLYRFAAKWRREGANENQLQSRLRGLNSRICSPPLEISQILKIARSAASLPVGGLDPLASACASALAENHYYVFDKLVAVIRYLDKQRPDHPILLPVERIGKLIGCDHTLVGRYRRRAVELGIIREIEPYIAHQKATRFKVLRLTSEMGPH